MLFVFQLLVKEISLSVNSFARKCPQLATSLLSGIVRIVSHIFHLKAKLRILYASAYKHPSCIAQLIKYAPESIPVLLTMISVCPTEKMIEAWGTAIWGDSSEESLLRAMESLYYDDLPFNIGKCIMMCGIYSALNCNEGENLPLSESEEEILRKEMNNSKWKNKIHSISDEDLTLWWDKSSHYLLDELCDPLRRFEMNSRPYINEQETLVFDIVKRKPLFVCFSYTSSSQERKRFRNSKIKELNKRVSSLRRKLRVIKKILQDF